MKARIGRVEGSDMPNPGCLCLGFIELIVFRESIAETMQRPGLGLIVALSERQANVTVSGFELHVNIRVWCL